MILQIPANVKTYELRGSVIWFSPEGILYSLPKLDASQDITNEELYSEMAVFRQIIGDKKVCMIAETHPTNSKQPPREQRSIIAAEISSVTKALAIVTSSSLSKMLASLFFAFVPPQYPVKMCKTEEEAKEWIKQYL